MADTEQYQEADVIPSAFMEGLLKEAKPISTLYYGEGRLLAEVVDVHRMGDGLHYRARVLCLDSEASLFDSDPSADCRQDQPPIVVGDEHSEMFRSGAEAREGAMWVAVLMRDSLGEAVRGMCDNFDAGHTRVLMHASSTGLRLDAKSVVIVQNDIDTLECADQRAAEGAGDAE